MASESAFGDARSDGRHVDGLGSSTVPDGAFGRTRNRVAVQHASGDRLRMDHQSVDHGSNVLRRLQVGRVGAGLTRPRDGVRNFLELAADAVGRYLGTVSSWLRHLWCFYGCRGSHHCPRRLANSRRLELAESNPTSRGS